MVLAACFTALCAALVGILVACERRGARRGVHAAKPAASAAFLALAASHLAAGSLSAYAALIAAGLVIGAAGDIALMLRGERAFLVGLVLFLLGHVAYVAACASLVPPDRWVALPAVIPVAAALAALTYLAPHVGSMRIPVALYVAAITTMAIGALAVVRAAPLPGLPARGAQLLAAGAALFFVSDLAVARDRFVRPGFENRAWGLPAYYAGQILIAWSLAPA